MNYKNLTNTARILICSTALCLAALGLTQTNGADARQPATQALRLEPVLELSTPWSTRSMVWSPDSKRIAFISSNGRVLDILDIASKKFSKIEVNDMKDGVGMLWSKTLNYLVLVRSTGFHVFDMNTLEPKQLYAVESKLPKLLSMTRLNANLINMGDDDYLVLGGNTNWKVDPTNPHIAAYSLKTGKRKLTYQFLNPPFDLRDGYGGPGFEIWHAKAAKNSQGDIMVAVHGNRSIQTQPNPYPAGRPINSEYALWIINLTRGKEQCYIRLYDDPDVIKNEYGHPALGSFSGLTIDPKGAWVLAAHSSQFNDAYDLQTCQRVHRLERELSLSERQRPGKRSEERPTVSEMTVSPDGRWLFGSSAWYFNPTQAPRRIWRTSDWQQVYEGTYKDNGLVTLAAFSLDGEQLAWTDSRHFVIYRLVDHKP